MKRLLLITTLLAATGAPAFAQDANTMFRAEADPTEIHASNLIGMRIYRSEGAEAQGYAGVQNDWDDIGEVNDVILSRDGQVEAVLVDIGGFLGMGENQVAVDMSALRFVSDDATADNESDFFLVLNAPRESLEQAPAYLWSDTASGTAPMNGTATDADTTGMATADGKTTGTMTDPAGTDMTAATPGVDPGMDTRQPVERDGYMSAEDADLTAERLTGAEAYDANDERIGEVSEIVLRDDGRVDSVIVDVGGFLGIGEKPVQLRLSEIDILRSAAGEDLRVYISMTENELKSMPDYQG